MRLASTTSLDTAGALRAELGQLKPSALRRRAQEAGASAAAVEQAEDSDDPWAAMTELVVRLACTTSSGAGALQAELSRLKPSALRRLAQEAGASEAEVEQAEDSDDPRAAMTELIMRLARTPASDACSGGSTLQAELGRLKPSACRRRARKAGFEQAEDSDGPQAATTQLSMRLASMGQLRYSRLRKRARDTGDAHAEHPDDSRASSMRRSSSRSGLRADGQIFDCRASRAETEKAGHSDEKSVVGVPARFVSTRCKLPSDSVQKLDCLCVAVTRMMPCDVPAGLLRDLHAAIAAAAGPQCSVEIVRQTIHTVRQASIVKPRAPGDVVHVFAAACGRSFAPPACWTLEDLVPFAAANAVSAKMAYDVLRAAADNTMPRPGRRKDGEPLVYLESDRRRRHHSKSQQSDLWKLCDGICPLPSNGFCVIRRRWGQLFPSTGKRGRAMQQFDQYTLMNSDGSENTQRKLFVLASEDPMSSVAQLDRQHPNDVVLMAEGPDIGISPALDRYIALKLASLETATDWLSELHRFCSAEHCFAWEAQAKSAAGGPARLELHRFCSAEHCFAREAQAKSAAGGPANQASSSCEECPSVDLKELWHNLSAKDEIVSKRKGSDCDGITKREELRLCR
eukprot:SAG31_NODE_5423_length_2547_cov_2.004902_1_plen_627_part_00